MTFAIPLQFVSHAHLAILNILELVIVSVRHNRFGMEVLASMTAQRIKFFSKESVNHASKVIL